MEKKKFGNSDMEISRIGLGTWAIGGNFGKWGWGDQQDDNSITSLQRALELGINWIDTAPCYGLGHSEEVVCKAVKESSFSPYIFTKCGLVWKDNKGELTGNLTKESIRKEIEDSLRRLNTDVIDLYQIHWPNPDKDIEEGWTEMAKLAEEGKVRYLGVSNFSVQQMKRAYEIFPITSLQPPYSLVDREVEAEVLPYCEENNIGVINYSPMGSGLLTGKMTKERFNNLPVEDWRHKCGLYQEPHFTKNLKLVEEMKIIAEKKSCSVGELAIAWTLLHPAVTAAITGVRNPQQVEGIIRASEVEITAEEKAFLDTYLITE